MGPVTNPPPPPPPVPPNPGEPFGQQPYGQQPPPPAPPPPPPPPGAYAPPPGFPPGPVAYAPATKPPRPRVPIAGMLLLAGAVLVLVGCLLPWVSGGEESLNGFDNYYCVDDLDCIGTEDAWGPLGYAEDGSATSFEPAAVLSVIGIVVLVAFGITFLAAGRVFAVAIISTILTAFGVLIALLFIGVASSAADNLEADIGLGVFVHLLGAIVAVAGSIVALAKRRRAAPVAYGYA